MSDALDCADDDEEQKQLLLQAAYTKALVRSLLFAGVKFLRYHALDVANGPRCKAKPLKMLSTSSSSSSSSSSCLCLDRQVCIAKICFGGLPNFADAPSPDCGLTAQGSLLLVPDMSTLRILPYSPDSAMVLCNLHEQDTGIASDLCSRSLLQKIVTKAAKEHKIAFNIGVELEFCLFDKKTNQPVDVSNFSSTTTLNEQDTFISDLYNQLVERQDIQVELIHAESAHGQLEVVLKYCTNPVEMADNIVLCRETIINVARLHGLKALFLPKLNVNAAGNGCHVHFSFSDIETGRNLFPNNNKTTTAAADDDEESTTSKRQPRRQSFILGSSHDISAQGRSFMEGILQHLPALLALTIPTANSFRRVGPGCWTGHSVGWDFEEKEAPLRVVANLSEQSWEHFEVKLIDSTANIYLALAGILAAGLNGLEKNLTLRPGLGEQAATAATTTPTTTTHLLPRTIEESLNLLQHDDFLMNSVLPQAMSRGYLAVRRDEANRASKMTLEEEVQEALDRA